MRKAVRWLFAVGLLLASPSYGATVQVTVTGVRNDHGHVLVAVCSRAEFLRPHCKFQGSAPARAGVVHVAIEGVPPGVYATEAFHDENDNGRLDRSFFGIPAEGMGFSNNAPMHFGPPEFEAAKFEVDDRKATVDFALRYY